MKLNEFETKLATVSDAKLRQMLTASRSTGPEVAVKLILAEAKRRGMEEASIAGDGDAGAPGSETSGYSREHAGYAGSDAPGASPDAALDADIAGPDAPATAPKWLNEETKSGLPVAVKILILLVVLSAILGLAWKFTR